MRSRRTVRGPLLVLALAVLAARFASAATPASLYDWMATAPIVVIGSIVVDDQRLIEIAPSAVLRGEVVAGTPLGVDVRSANRDRAADTPALKPINGQSFVMLLAPRTDAQGKRAKGYQLVHGPRGAREVPEEGRQILVEAVTRIAQVQALHDDTQVWRELRRMLEETNPLLVETALSMYDKFRRAGPEELPVLQPLLDHPRAEVRATAARVIGGVAGKREPIPPELSSQIVGELTARARRDDVILVRVAATGALAGFSSAAVDELLHAIAMDDPDQVVRLEAQKVLYERGAAEPPAPRPN